MALRRRSFVTVTTLRRLPLLGIAKRVALVVALAACTPREPAPTAPPPPPAPAVVERPILVAEADASVDATPDAGGAAPPPPRLPMSVEAFCPELTDEEEPDAGVRPAPTSPPAASLGNSGPIPPPLDVRFRTSRTAPTKEGIANHFESRALKAEVVVPSRRVAREVFRMTIADPVQCCAKANAESLVSNCMFSGIDVIHGRSITKREGDAIVIRWCVADLSTRQVMDRGEQKVPLPPGTLVRFVGPVPACDPKSIP